MALPWGLLGGKERGAQWVWQVLAARCHRCCCPQGAVCPSGSCDQTHLFCTVPSIPAPFPEEEGRKAQQQNPHLKLVRDALSPQWPQNQPWEQRVLLWESEPEPT